MSNAHVKICGVKDLEIAEHAIKCGASFLGFVFFKDSKRNISIEQCDKILNVIDGRVKTVAVTVDPSNDDLKIYSKKE